MIFIYSIGCCFDFLPFCLFFSFNFNVGFTVVNDIHFQCFQNRPPRNNSRKIRVGYISPDFFTHSVSYFAEVLLKHGDKEKFEIFCFSNVVKEDRKTLILKGHVDPEKWRPIYGKNAQMVIEMINKEQIDVLIELTGHTAGNRLDVMANKPAPIQVTMIGYPNTTGLTAIDYRITDIVADPLDTEQKYVEKLVRLPNFLCYTPTDEYIEIQPAPYDTNKFITFGTFNNLAKITPEVLTLWARIMKTIPESRFLMKCKPFVNKRSCEKVHIFFYRLIFSINGERVVSRHIMEMEWNVHDSN